MTCELSGHVGWDDEMVKTWDGKWVLKEYFEERHPQDYVRSRNEDQSVPVARPEATVQNASDLYPNGVTYGEEETLTNTLIVGQSGRDTLTTTDDQYGFMQDPDNLQPHKNYGQLLPAYFEGVDILKLYVNRAGLVVLDFGQQHGNYVAFTIRFDNDPTTDVSVIGDDTTFAHYTYTTTDEETFAYLEQKKANAKQHGKGTIVTFTAESGVVEESVVIAPVDGQVTTGEGSVETEYESDIDTFTCESSPFTPDVWAWELLNADTGVTTSGSTTESTVTIQSLGAAGNYNFYLKVTATETATGCSLVAYSEQLAQTIVEPTDVYSLPLLENRWEDGVDGAAPNNNHAVLTRTTTAPVKEQDGTIALASINEARFQDTNRTAPGDGVDYGTGVLGKKYDDTALESDGLVIKEGAINLIPYSEVFGGGGGADWTLLGNTTTEETTEDSPDGTGVVWKINFPSNSEPAQAPRAYKGVSTNPLSPNTEGFYNFSIWVKQPDTNASSHIALRMHDGGVGADDGYVKFAVPTTWTRISTTQELPASALNYAELSSDGANPATDPRDTDILGDVLIWGAQMDYKNLSDPGERSYLPTSGIYRIVEHDDVEINWPIVEVNDFLIEFDIQMDTAAACTMMESNTFRIWYDGTNLKATNGVGTATYAWTPADWTSYKITAEFNSTTGFTINVDGSGASSSDTTNLNPGAKLQIGSKADLTEHINGTIRNIIFAPF